MDAEYSPLVSLGIDVSFSLAGGVAGLLIGKELCAAGMLAGPVFGPPIVGTCLLSTAAVGGFVGNGAAQRLTSPKGAEISETQGALAALGAASGLWFGKALGGAMALVSVDVPVANRVGSAIAAKAAASVPTTWEASALRTVAQDTFEAFASGKPVPELLSETVPALERQAHALGVEVVEHLPALRRNFEILFTASGTSLGAIGGRPDDSPHPSDQIAPKQL